MLEQTRQYQKQSLQKETRMNRQHDYLNLSDIHLSFKQTATDWPIVRVVSTPIVRHTLYAWSSASLTTP